jgi:hypothetical protein
MEMFLSNARGGQTTGTPHRFDLLRRSFIRWLYRLAGEVRPTGRVASFVQRHANLALASCRIHLFIRFIHAYLFSVYR